MTVNGVHSSILLVQYAVVTWMASSFSVEPMHFFAHGGAFMTTDDDDSHP